MPQRPERRREYDRLRARTERRKAWFRAYWPKGRGERVTQRTVEAVRHLVHHDGETMAEVARRFGLSYSYVNELVHWKKRRPGGREEQRAAARRMSL